MTLWEFNAAVEGVVKSKALPEDNVRAPTDDAYWAAVNNLPH